jgi:hypothetical protein
MEYLLRLTKRDRFLDCAASPRPSEGFFVAGVAQLVRASGCGSEGRGFDPRRLPHFNSKSFRPSRLAGSF